MGINKFQVDTSENIDRDEFNFFDYIGGVFTEIRSDTDKLDLIIDYNGNPISDRTGAPHYEFGNLLEIKNKLANKSKNDLYPSERYPLIILDEKINQKLFQEQGEFIRGSLSLLFLTETRREGIDNYPWFSSERMTKTMKNVLQPLVWLFLDKLKTKIGDELTAEDLDEPFKPDWEYLFFYNSIDTNQNALNALVDGIEISNLEIRVNKKYCKSQQNY